METKTITGDLAISHAMHYIADATITETRSGFCCDSGYFSSENESDRESLLFSLLIYRNDPENISVTYVAHKNELLVIDWTHPVSVIIVTGDSGEPSQSQFDIVPNGYVWPCENCKSQAGTDTEGFCKDCGSY